MNFDPHTTLRRRAQLLFPLCWLETKVPRGHWLSVSPLAHKLHNTRLWQSHPSAGWEKKEDGRISLISHRTAVAGEKQVIFVLLGKSVVGRKKEGRGAKRNAHGKLPLTLWRKGKDRGKSTLLCQGHPKSFLWREKEGDQGHNTAPLLH